MKRSFFLLLILLVQFRPGWAQTVQSPERIYGELFYDVQRSGIFPDSKTFVDVVPRKDPKIILDEYKKIRNNPAIRFSLELFVEANFILPDTTPSSFRSTLPLRNHIDTLWRVLKRKPLSDTCAPGNSWCRGSLLPLPNEYIVPGGRFREVYYWDSYFTMLGLRESGDTAMIRNMVDNFAILIGQYGHIPNGNRSYYLSRSQPPFFSLMVDLLAAERKDSATYVQYYAALKEEYDYWMDRKAPTKHVVKMPDGSLLNRYYDQLAIPRQESFIEDEELGEKLPAPSRPMLYRNLRSAAESGWDFSSRWLRDGKSLATIETINLVPVDLNCLLYHLEKVLAAASRLKDQNSAAQNYLRLAGKRKKTIDTYLWSESLGWYVDYYLPGKKRSNAATAAGMFPLYFKLAGPARASKAKQTLEKKFLKPGGMATTLVQTGQQWDAPNGWAPLQWISITALENYGYKTLAKELATRWVALNKKVFRQTGKLMEKYNVEKMDLDAGGGEYPAQDGFGWTNGVLIALINQYNLN
jgi:alpha,alpha-trehalase